MAFLHRLRSYLLPVGMNLALFLWAWLGVNDGKGLFYFTMDITGLEVLLALAVLLNAVLWLVAYLRQDFRWARAFGWLVLLLVGGCTSVVVDDFLSGGTL
jgi:hypothetical protein